MLTLALLIAAFVTADADRVHSGAERLDYCRDRAARLSGYDGPRPKDYRRRTGPVRGALRGAVASGVIAEITGGDFERGARRGAASGAVVGTVRRIEQDKRFDRQRDYQRELDRCMPAPR